MTLRQLTRESILSGETRRMAMAQAGNQMRFMEDHERQAIVDRMLATMAPNESLWVFGYGSLMWNPAIHFIDRTTARIFGHHRRFCLWSTLGRGSPEKPGLMLALDRGGSCHGVAYEVAPAAAATELDILFRRELMTSAYRPIWTRVHLCDGNVRRAITFVIDPDHDRYAHHLGEHATVKLIAESVGSLGRCSEYLYDTLTALDNNGLGDKRLSKLARMVREHQKCNGIG